MTHQGHAKFGRGSAQCGEGHKERDIGARRRGAGGEGGGLVSRWPLPPVIAVTVRTLPLCDMAGTRTYVQHCPLRLFFLLPLPEASEESVQREASVGAWSPTMINLVAGGAKRGDFNRRLNWKKKVALCCVKHASLIQLIGSLFFVCIIPNLLWLNRTRGCSSPTPPPTSPASPSVHRLGWGWDLHDCL